MQANPHRGRAAVSEIQVNDVTISNGEFVSQISRSWNGQRDCVTLIVGYGANRSSIFIPVEAVPDVLKLLKMYLGDQP